MRQSKSILRNKSNSAISAVLCNLHKIIIPDPNLLLYNLFRKNEDCLTNCEYLETNLKYNIISNFMTIIMKISNCSKTRLCLKLLYHNYSLYFVTVLLNFEAIDLENASE